MVGNNYANINSDRAQQETFLTQILAPDQDQMPDTKFDFDAEFPATRYFKDTVNFLTHPEPCKTQSCKRDPRVWEWSPEKGRLSTLLDEIASISGKTEAGVNLPAYNYVINYHIPPYGRENPVHYHRPCLQQHHTERLRPRHR